MSQKGGWMKLYMTNILVADDDAAILDAIKLILEEEGYKVNTTEDGESIYKMNGNFPDLMLLDIWMSGENGTDICKYLKSNQRTKNIPIIMISANRDALEMANKAGADDFVAKPFEIDTLVNCIKKNLDKYHN